MVAAGLLVDWLKERPFDCASMSCERGQCMVDVSQCRKEAAVGFVQLPTEANVMAVRYRVVLRLWMEGG
jgi:hypothetical protein